MNTFGSSLSRRDGAFEIVSAQGSQRVPADGIRSIQISRGAQITSDAAMLAIENEIEVLFMDRAGNPMGRIWSPKYGSISTIRKGQLAFSFSSDAVDWIKDVILRKIENQQAMLLMMNVEDDAVRDQVRKSINRMEDYRTKVRLLEGDIVADVASQLRGWEGVASKIYFETMNLFLPENLRFAARSQHPAMDVVNAMLNYGYGLLYSKVEGSLIRAGIDPYIGILHRDDYNRPVLAYDVIELYRVWVDYVVYSLASQDIITDEFFSVKDDGSVWLEGLGRRILIQSVNDYLDEVITQNGLPRSRAQQILVYCQDLAGKFKKYE